MRPSTVLIAVLVLVLAVAGCGAGGDDATPAGAPETSTPTTVPSTTVASSVADESGLAERGQYGVGSYRFATVDPARDNREIRLEAWYPALVESGSPIQDAPPDLLGAPYPVVTGDSKIGALLGPHLASHGLVFLTVMGQSGSSGRYRIGEHLIEYPREQLLGLDALEAHEFLSEVADTDQAGVVGYSFGGLIALSMTGATFDTDHYREMCADPDRAPETGGPSECAPADEVAAFEAYATDTGFLTPEGEWLPITDERIKAAMPMAPGASQMFSPDSLAAASVPVLLVGNTADTINPYVLDTVYYFENIGSEWAELLSFVGASHMAIFQNDAVLQVKRFGTAFFGLHLKGDDWYAQYLTPEFAEDVAPTLGEAASFRSFETLIWGVHETVGP